jgi:hypothetical protein
MERQYTWFASGIGVSGTGQAELATTRASKNSSSEVITLSTVLRELTLVDAYTRPGEPLKVQVWLGKGQHVRYGSRHQRTGLEIFADMETTESASTATEG